MKQPIMVDVESSNIRSLGHDGESLFVAFKNGGVYAYDCPHVHYANGLGAKSPGTWLRKEIAGKFPHRKVS